MKEHCGGRISVYVPVVFVSVFFDTNALRSSLCLYSDDGGNVLLLTFTQCDVDSVIRLVHVLHSEKVEFIIERECMFPKQANSTPSSH